jgi:hypothetical protein
MITSSFPNFPAFHAHDPDEVDLQRISAVSKFLQHIRQ